MRRWACAVALLVVVSAGCTDGAGPTDGVQDVVATVTTVPG